MSRGLTRDEVERYLLRRDLLEIERKMAAEWLRCYDLCRLDRERALEALEAGDVEVV
jgi:hypothetical protein